MKYHIFAIMIVVVLAAGCTQEQPRTEIYIEGHPQVYKFSYDLGKTSLIESNNPAAISAAMASTNNITFFFDGSDQQDNGYTRVAIINILQKLTPYYAYNGRIMKYNSYYYTGETWFNSTGGEVQKPEVGGTVIWFLGPVTGANETSVEIRDNIIFIQGTSKDNFLMAADKFVLIIFGIDSEVS